MSSRCLITLVIIFGLILCLLPIVSLAQEDMTSEITTTNVTQNLTPESVAPEQTQVETPQENIEYSFGTIANVNDIDAGKFVVKEYAYDKDADVEVTYSADSSATFENINSLKDIAVGDMAELSYVVDADGNRTAKIIRIFKPPTNPGPSQEGIAPGEAAPEASTPEAVSPEPTSPEPTP